MIDETRCKSYTGMEQLVKDRNKWRSANQPLGLEQKKNNDIFRTYWK